MLHSRGLGGLLILLRVASALRLGFGPRTPPVVVLGPGANTVLLCAAKLAAKAGCRTWVVTNDEVQARKLMYGAQQDGPAQAISSTSDIADALAECEAVIVCCDSRSGPLSTRSTRAIFEYATKLKDLAMLSSIGGGKAMFPGKSLVPGEDTLGELCRERGIQFSIVRVGNLKGGGPGEVATTGPKAGHALTDHGLSKTYYDQLLDLAQATATMSYDRFTAGAELVIGDPYPAPNPLVSMATAGDFTPRPTDCNAVCAGGALVAAVRRKKSRSGDCTVSAAAGPTPPSADDWLALVEAVYS